MVLLRRFVMVAVIATAWSLCARQIAGAATDTAPGRPFDVQVHGSGRPVILIPGLSTTGAVWDETAARLRDRYEVHVLTLAGFGGPDAIGEPFLPRVIEAVAEYAAARPGGRAVLVGHSLGAFVAFGAAARAPGAVAGVLAVDGVPFIGALSNPAATPETLAPQAMQIRTMYATMSTDQFAMQTRLALAGMITSPEHVERAAGWAAATTPAAAGIAVAEMMTTDLRSEIGTITAPVHLIGALGAVPDAMQPVVRQAYAAQVAALPRASVTFAVNARHFIMLDAPNFFFASLDALLEEAAWTR